MTLPHLLDAKVYRETADWWTAHNPVLPLHSIGQQSTEPFGMKVGDGSTPWNGLPYFASEGSIAASSVSYDPTGRTHITADDAQGALDQLDSAISGGSADIFDIQTNLSSGISPQLLDVFTIQPTTPLLLRSYLLPIRDDAVGGSLALFIDTPATLHTSSLTLDVRKTTDGGGALLNPGALGAAGAGAIDYAAGQDQVAFTSHDVTFGGTAITWDGGADELVLAEAGFYLAQLTMHVTHP